MGYLPGTEDTVIHEAVPRELWSAGVPPPGHCTLPVVSSSTPPGVLEDTAFMRTLSFVSARFPLHRRVILGRHFGVRSLMGRFLRGWVASSALFRVALGSPTS